jgi:hypothetical protein
VIYFLSRLWGETRFTRWWLTLSVVLDLNRPEMIELSLRLCYIPCASQRFNSQFARRFWVGDDAFPFELLTSEKSLLLTFLFVCLPPSTSRGSMSFTDKSQTEINRGRAEG